MSEAQEQTKQLEAKQGIHSILLFRLLKEAEKQEATKLAFQTEHEVGKSRDVDGQKTKDGIIQSVGALEYDFKATSILAKGDVLAAKLEKAMEDGDLVEIWDIDSEEAIKNGSSKLASVWGINNGTNGENNKYLATYYQGYISSFSAKKNAEENIVIEMEFAINGVGKKGLATLTNDQKKAVQYAFKDTTSETKKENSFEM
ncbi:TPA: phage major tail protein, TP901-1 family [Streptococcus pyogenes]|uniref:phage major tail protein, TP901-1 family n=1 Tax=Streptococcus pyogenes TaxID=1314 RepID=UPI0001E10262|nr:phage major tail protein, TP901-1 family [Streptococcus pyogenes]HER4515959.1 phage major tail protein, TP901-1 family [Streptococcus pyogenes NGAS743]HER4524745.1 phage major tail protein, TP901-1 family [Streptococcus pyogenes NGAS747]HER4528149.1 phage major tail protein, TP901-1 family [Streptococcus pyogenes NGAS739]HER4539687.1 phage major tail protein, TP901-1 family [Streptococcus pyogenes NGAS668]HER4543109.1 phage major tail protein, TP901-1 family [Streptococcus pyogenes NGAS669]